VSRLLGSPAHGMVVLPAQPYVRIRFGAAPRPVADRRARWRMGMETAPFSAARSVARLRLPCPSARRGTFYAVADLQPSRRYILRHACMIPPNAARSTSASRRGASPVAPCPGVALPVITRLRAIWREIGGDSMTGELAVPRMPRAYVQDVIRHEERTPHARREGEESLHHRQ